MSDIIEQSPTAMDIASDHSEEKDDGSPGSADHVMTDDNPNKNGTNGDAEIKSEDKSGASTEISEPLPTRTPRDQIKTLHKQVNGIRKASAELASPSNSVSTSTAHSHPSSLRLDKDVARFTELLNETSPAAALKFLKDQWRQVLFADNQEENLEYILKAGLKNITTTMVEKLLKDRSRFADAFLKKAGNTSLVNSIIVEDILLHVTAEQVLKNIPMPVLQDVSNRLPTVQPAAKVESEMNDAQMIAYMKQLPARKLVGLLAEAGRLGYQKDDLIDIPTEAALPNVRNENPVGFLSHLNQPPPMPKPRPIPHMPPMMPMHQTIAPNGNGHGHGNGNGYDPLLAEQERNQAEVQRQQPRFRDYAPRTAWGGYVCPFCSHEFGQRLSGYNHHVHKKVCQKTSTPDKPYVAWCINCAQGFVGKQGLEYHAKKGVCDSQDGTRAMSPSTQLLQANTNTVPRPPVPNFTLQPQQYQQQQLQNPSQYQPSQHEQQQAQLMDEVPVPAPVPSNAPTQNGLPTESSPQINSPEDKKTRTYTKRQNYERRGPYGARKSEGSDMAVQTAKATPKASRPSLPANGVTNSGKRLFPSELPPDQKEKLEKAIDEQEKKYTEQQANVDTSLTQAEREKKLLSLKQNNATKKSQIRKSFGVTVRQRLKDGNKTKNSAVRPALENFRATAESAPITMRQSSPMIPTGSGFSPINVIRRVSTTATASALQSQPNSSSPPNAAAQTNGSHSQFTKRLRTDDGSREGSSHLGTGQTSPDGEERGPRKVPVAQAQSQWEALRGIGTSARVEILVPATQQSTQDDTPMIDAPTAAPQGSEHEVIDLSAQDSEEEDEDDTEQTLPGQTEVVEQSGDEEDQVGEVLPSVETPEEVADSDAEMEAESESSEEIEVEAKVATRGSSSKRGRPRGRGRAGRGGK